MRTILDWLNPRNAEKGITSWWKFHLLVSAPSVIIVVAILFFVLGFGAGFGTAKYGETYFRTHYPQHELRVPPPIGAPLPPIGAPAQHTAYIRQGFAGPVVDQGFTNACVSMAFTEAYTYLYNAARYDAARKRHKTAPRRIAFAPSWLWNVRNRGTDDTSLPTDYPPLLARYGDIPRSQYHYADSQIVAQYPSSYWFAAQKHRYRVRLEPLSGNTLGGGQGLVNVIKAEIAKYRLGVILAIPIFPSSLDAANEHAGHVDLPTPGDSYTGGHEIFVKGFDDRHCFQGVCGWLWVQNSYGRNFGVGGNFWLSYRLVRQWAYAVAALHLNPKLTPGGRTPPRATDPNAPTHPAPATPPTVGRTPSIGGNSWYVHGVVITTGQDVSPLLNAAGDRYHVWPVGLAATLGVESALNPYSERWAGGLDNSCGLAQQILTNVAAETGIYDGRAACNWEEVPANSIYLEAKLYAEYFAFQHNCVTWPYAYGMYNAGPGLSCGYYYAPGGDVAAHLQNFIGWYDFALSHWQGGHAAAPPAPPKPKVFPKSRWCAYAAGHHLPCPAIYEKHGKTYRLTWAASQYPAHLWLRGKEPYRLDTWVAPNKHAGRKHGFTVYRFAGGTLTCWPSFGTCKAQK